MRILVSDGEEIIMSTVCGQAVRSPVNGIRVIGRSTSGVKLITLEKGDRLVGISKVIEIPEWSIIIQSNKDFAILFIFI